MSKITILVVEDEAIVAMDIRQRLEGLGYVVTGTAASGDAAVASVRETPPNLILMDIMLQGDMDGIDTAAKINESYDIPIIFLTANSDESTLQRAKSVGPLAYLLKPFEERELRTSIEIALYRNELERKLRSNREFLSTVLKSIGDAVIITDSRGRVTFMNWVAERLTGWSSAEAIERDAEEIFKIRNENDGQVIESPIRLALSTGRIVELGNHAVLITKSGDVIPIEDTAAPIRSQTGSIEGTVLVFRDVKKRKQMERDLQNYRTYLEKLVNQKTEELTLTSEQLNKEIEENARIEEKKIMLRSLVENSPDVIGIAALNGRLKYLNKAARQLTGINESEISKYSVFRFLTKEQRKELKEHIGGCIMREKSWFGELTFSDNRHDRVIPTETNAFLIYPSDKYQALCVGFIMRNIKERKVAERNQKVLQEQLYRAERMKAIGILAGGVAHDLNNMLGPLVGYPDLILRKIDQDHPMRKMVEKMGKSANDAAGVVRDLLTLARRGRYDLATVNLNQTMTSYLESIPYLKLKSDRPEVQVTCRFDETIPNIKGSNTHLHKVIMNLMVNAFEAMQDGGGTVTIETSSGTMQRLQSGYDKMRPGEYVRLRIADTGKGIAPDDLPKIFEPYFSRKQIARSGSGLGLSIVYGIVKDHNGYYDVISTVGKGSEFVLYFPAVSDSVESSGDDNELPGGTEHILIVDDDQDQRELAHDLLSSLGYRVSMVNNGHEALDFLRHGPVDIVVLDMIMEPNFDGLSTFREILKIRPDQKTVVVSGFSQTDRVREMQKIGAGAYIRKPYSLDELAQAVREELDKITAAGREMLPLKGA